MLVQKLVMNKFGSGIRIFITVRGMKFWNGHLNKTLGTKNLNSFNTIHSKFMGGIV